MRERNCTGDEKHERRVRFGEDQEIVVRDFVFSCSGFDLRCGLFEKIQYYQSDGQEYDVEHHQDRDAEPSDHPSCEERNDRETAGAKASCKAVILA